MPPGGLVYQLDAMDKDSGPNSRLQFYLSGSASSHFNLESSTGLLTSRQALSRDTRHHLQVEVFDSGKPAMSTKEKLVISVADSNLFPTFTSSVSKVLIKEGELTSGKVPIFPSVFTLVTLIVSGLPMLEANSINGRDVNYKISAGNLHHIFSIDRTTGEIKVVKEPNHEVAETFDVYFGAYEDSQEQYSSLHKVTVKVEDVNDNSPTFSQDYYQAGIKEGQFPPVSVIKVAALDADTGDNGEVRYRLTSQQDKFDIDQITGEITTLAKLDREKQEQYLIRVEAVDGGDRPRTGATTIQVTVEDINDNPPKFTRILSINITENSPIGTSVVTVETVDKDIGENARVTYEFNENPGSKFSIDPVTGEIVVTGFLDREERDEYLLKVVATDGAWRAETTVGINIQDENDNTPTFEEEEYTLMFPPGSAHVAVVGRVNARDTDETGPNSHIKYSLRETSAYFSIESSSGEILSKKNLRYVNTTRSQPTENEYALIVIATDGGAPPTTSETRVRIMVTDRNSKPPQFNDSEYIRPLPSLAKVGMDLLTVHAEDKVDTGLNAEVVYSLEGGQYREYFSIDPKTGVIRVQRSLGQQSSTTYSLEVKATDKGEPPLSSTAIVRLMPSGNNVHAPVFSNPRTQVIIPENEPTGTFIIKLSATDRDAGINGMIRYAITEGNGQEMFEVDEKTGNILIRKNLDYENENEYHLNIEAYDLAFKSKKSNAVLKIILTDVNDNIPFFEQSQYDAYLQENLPAGTEIIQMEAVDLDSSKHAEIEFSFVEEQIKKFFEINQKTGVIRSKESFDYEKYPEYQMHVVARNPGIVGESSALLTIHITGSNEFFPRFLQPVFQFAVSESALQDTEVGQIRAVDQDKGSDGQVFYFLIGQSNDQGFKINKTSGVISVAESLDRELQNRFVLTVLAKNRGSILGNDTDEAQVIIQVQDGNDPPQFRKSEYQAIVAENVAVGTTVITVSAVDKDVRPRNSQFSYSIIGGNNDAAFEIDPSSGSIRTVSSLDREEVETYLLNVAAIDNGSPPQTGTATVVVRLSDVNDNPPFLDDFNRQGALKENSPPNTLVARLQPQDKDLPPNTGPFKFYLTGGEHKDLFKVDENTGDLRSKASIDRETYQELHIMVDIYDSGTPPMMTKYPITIDVSDENDNPSEPRILTIIVQTLSGDFPGGVVAPVRPKDPDTTGDYSCEIKRGPTNIFTMDENCYLSTGRLMNVNSYNLTVQGTDGIHDSVTSQVYMTFDKFEEQARQQAFIIRIAENLRQDTLAQVFKQINFHSSATGSVQILSVITGGNHTDFFVAVQSKGRYVEKDAAVRALKKELGGLAKLLGDTEHVIGYNGCLEQPCSNGGRCATSMEVNTQTVIMEAGDIILNSPMFEEKTTCTCQENFKGPTCDLKSNPCENPNPCQGGAQCIQLGYEFKCLCPAYLTGDRCEVAKTSACDRNPCENGGKCRESSSGDFFCLCRPGFQGGVCQIAVDPCQPNPCQHGGECLPKKSNYQCKCPDNYYGTNCEKSTFGFGELSYMTFPPLNPNTNDISITFSTTKSDSLLIYNFGDHDSGGRSDFISIELVGGQAVFSFGGRSTAVKSITVNKQVADGRWFKVTATRNNKVASLSVEDCTESGEFCKSCLAGDDSCFSKAIGDTGTLNFGRNHTMFFGGINSIEPIKKRPDQVKSDDFVGCVKSLTINGQLMNLKSSFISSQGILASCPIRGSLCASHDCGSGECRETSWMAMCTCPGGVEARDCAQAIHPISLKANATILFEVSEKHQRRQFFAKGSANKISSGNKNSEISFSFRTEVEGGQLFSAPESANSYTRVYIEQGKLVYETKKGRRGVINVTSEDSVSDGGWHTVQIKQSQQILQVFLDEGQLSYDLESSSTHDFLSARLTGLQFGGRRRLEAPGESTSCV